MKRRENEREFAMQFVYVLQIPLDCYERQVEVRRTVGYNLRCSNDKVSWHKQRLEGTIMKNCHVDYGE